MQSGNRALLQGIPVFGGLREDALELILEGAPMVAVSKGDYFFREGEKGESLFILETGRVAILKSWEGREYLLSHLGRGDCFGEMAMIDFGPRSASVRAVEDSRAIELSMAALNRLYGKDAEQYALLHMNMGREVSRRLRDANNWLFKAKIGADFNPDGYTIESS